MKFRQSPVPHWHLALLALLSLAIFYIAEHTSQNVQQPRYRTKLKAAELAARAEDVIKAEMNRRGLKIDSRNDPWGSGLIGEERTVITSDRGVSTAKILAANPNFAAAFVDLLHRAGAHKGDTVAIGLTGSIPGWNIAMLSACSAVGVQPIVISSVGASDWGANRPDLTWLDMEKLLRENGVLPFKSIAASLGGGADIGRGISPEGRDLIRAAVKRNDVDLIEGETLEDIIDKRMVYYGGSHGSQNYAVYINIGGGLASLGGALNARLIPPGFSRTLPELNYPVRAVINRMAEKQIPIINLSDVAKMAERYDLPSIVTSEPPEVGQGSLYFSERYDITWSIILTSALCLIVFIVIRVDLSHYLRRRPRTATVVRPEAI